MSLVAQLVGFGLRQVIGDFADSAVQIVTAVEQRFRDHSQTLPKALDHAHNRAWQALGVALAGDGLLDRVKVFFASGDDKGVREQVHCFLASNAVSFDGAPADFRRDCLDELKRLRKSGMLSTAAGSSAEIARQAAGFRRHADPQGLIEESRRAVAGVADALAEGYPNLSRLLRAPTPAGPPLLAAAFCYFFRREVETNDELAHGLFFDGLRQLSASQARAFGEVGKAPAALGGQFDALFEQLGRIETEVVETHAVAVETHGAVLDLRAAMHQNVGVVRCLIEQVLLHLGQVGMTRDDVRPGNDYPIRGEDKRRPVKARVDGAYIGIDFGPSNSVVANFQYGQAEVIPNHEGQKWTPSIVTLRRDGTLAFGQEAKENFDEQRSIRSIKRILGTPERVPLVGQNLRTEQIAVMLFSLLKKDAEQALNENFTKAVVTIPANSKGLARHATKLCAGAAGLQVLTLINEPTAAAICYGLNAQDDQTVLVYDFGGGTLDVTILHIHHGIFEEVSSKGIGKLGGDDLDAAAGQGAGRALSGEDRLRHPQFAVQAAVHARRRAGQDRAVHGADGRRPQGRVGAGAASEPGRGDRPRRHSSGRSCRWSSSRARPSTRR